MKVADSKEIKAQLIEAYKQYSGLLDRHPSQNELIAAFKEGYFPSYHLVRKHFGGLTGLRNAAEGIEVKEPAIAAIERKQAIEQVKIIAASLKRTPKQKELRAYAALKQAPTGHQITKLFGTYTDLLMKAGLVKRFTRQNMLAEYKKLADRLQKTPSMEDVDKESAINPNFPSRGLLVGEFGSFRKLAQSARLAAHKSPRTWTEEEMTAALKKMILKLNSIPSHDQHVRFAKNGVCPHPSTVIQHFGNLYIAYEKALNTVPQKAVRERLLESLDSKTKTLDEKKVLKKLTLRTASVLLCELLEQQEKIPTIDELRKHFTSLGCSPAITYKMTRYKGGYYDFVADSIQLHKPDAESLQPLYATAKRLSVVTKNQQNSWDDEDIIDACTGAWINAGGAVPKYGQLHQLSSTGSFPSITLLQRRFGSVKEVFKIASEPEHVRRYLLDHLTDYMHSQKKIPGVLEWETASARGQIPPTAVIEQILGEIQTLTDQVIKHGLYTSTLIDGIRTNEEKCALQLLRNFYKASGTLPYWDRVPANIRDVAINCYGSLQKAAAVAGFPGFF